jgi:hypothetical protein
MTLHIGIVACSAEGAALCYRTVCAEGATLLGPHTHPEVSMHTPSLSDYMACIEKDDWAGVGELMLVSARKLAAIGADFLICPDNTIHQALPFILERSPLPWLHIADEVAMVAAKRGYRRLGLTGTRWSRAAFIRTSWPRGAWPSNARSSRSAKRSMRLFSTNWSTGSSNLHRWPCSSAWSRACRTQVATPSYWAARKSRCS